MIKLITNCIELNPLGSSSVAAEADINRVIDYKQKVLDYLMAGKDAGVFCSSVEDKITGIHLSQTIHKYTDEEYTWTDEDIYHFEKYNIKLNEDFLKKVLSA